MGLGVTKTHTIDITINEYSIRIEKYLGIYPTGIKWGLYIHYIDLAIVPS